MWTLPINCLNQSNVVTFQAKNYKYRQTSWYRYLHKDWQSCVQNCCFVLIQARSYYICRDYLLCHSCLYILWKSLCNTIFDRNYTTKQLAIYAVISLWVETINKLRDGGKRKNVLICNEENVNERRKCLRFRMNVWNGDNEYIKSQACELEVRRG